MKSNGFTSEMKIELFSMARLSVLMRVENIADIFNSELESQTVNLKQFAKDLFVMMNGDDIEVALEMTELSLSGNQPYDTMTANKIHWLTVDDGVDAPRAFVDSNDTIELQ